VAASDNTLRLLQAAFSKKEWDHLSHHGAFKYQLDNDDGSAQSYETLVNVGNLLLRQYTDARALLDEFGDKQD
jgi:hypothetical protein